MRQWHKLLVRSLGAIQEVNFLEASRGSLFNISAGEYAK
jgi:hypothetical protein